MTMQLTPEQRHREIDSHREWLKEEPPLPSAEELARPLIDGLMTLHHVFSDRG